MLGLAGICLLGMLTVLAHLVPGALSILMALTWFIAGIFSKISAVAEAVTIRMNVEIFTAAVGVLVSLLFSYIPGVATWYNKLDSEHKSMWMAIIALVMTGAIFGLSCANILNSVTCDKTGLLELVWIFILFIMANQGAHSISPKIGLKKSGDIVSAYTTPTADSD